MSERPSAMERSQRAWKAAMEEHRRFKFADTDPLGPIEAEIRDAEQAAVEARDREWAVAIFGDSTSWIAEMLGTPESYGRYRKESARVDRENQDELLREARADERERWAKWHDEQKREERSAYENRLRVDDQLNAEYHAGKRAAHRESAAAIRALGEEK